MERWLPIVPGCRALVINAVNHPEDIGKEVMVIERFDPHRWICDADFLPKDAICVFREKNLLRIDGGDFKHEQDSHELPLETMK